MMHERYTMITYSLRRKTSIHRVSHEYPALCHLIKNQRPFETTQLLSERGTKKKMMDHAVTILPLITKQGLKTFKQTRYWDITSPTLASRTGLYCCLHSGGRSPSWPSPGLALPLFCSFPKEIHIYTSINQDKEVTWEFVELLFLVKVSLPLVQQTSARINNNDGFRILNNVRLFKTFR